ncbi:hypothetical protein GFS31_17200 [Leptolyngbya sp. BL0902]|uniref:hypothetical protein n=1 Tax=Leptolyngbya sp. BL0902 TaxID=1115757 RepID=UPI0018E81564|nr:hypothetical protein [Leptolyngbya sp. BL0902]QQE65035.1 hypothetical protein GFS31_17200 [Leptolyngbya sp. BL0902]
MGILRQRYGVVALALLALGGLGSAAALAQTANFAPITLSSGQPTATVSGTTAGIFSVGNLAMRDQRGTICVGFADASPSHILTLQDPMAQITLQVNSGGSDTTLLLQGPTDSLIRCGEDSGRRNLDDRIQAQNLPAGTYRIWVGSHDQGQRINYSLTVGP